MTKIRPIMVGCKICQQPTNWDKNNKCWRIYCSRNCVNLDSHYINQKRKTTTIERHGVDHNWSTGVLRDVQQETIKTRYGVANPQQNKEVREKTKQTNIERYGYENVFNNPNIYKASIQTKLVKYGVENVTYKDWNSITLEYLTNYSWLFHQYVELFKTATQIAIDLNVDITTVCNYLRNHDIPIRYKTHFSHMCISWLDSIIDQDGFLIQHALNGGEYLISGTRLKADGFCVETNTIYEFHGDYWHGNPEIYSPEVINEVNGLTMGELYQKTIEKENLIKAHKNNYNLVVMWEFNWITKQ